MKNIFFISMLILGLNCIQSQSSLDTQLSNINQSSVTSGIIYERVTQFSDLYNFNKNGYNVASYDYFRQALNELRRASNHTRLISLSQLDNLSNTTQGNLLPIAILNTPFHILNYNHANPSLGGLTFNETTQKYGQISGKQAFLPMQISMIAPTKKTITGSNVVFSFTNLLYIKNGGLQIKTMVVNLGDGINRTVINNQMLTNQQITINYTSSSDKTITANITYTNNTTRTTKGVFYFKYVNPTQAPNFPSPLCNQNDIRTKDEWTTAEEQFQGYETNDPKIYPKIQHRTFYASASFHSDLKVYKPVIIIDGFDPDDLRRIQDCDCLDDAKCANENKTDGVFDPEKHESMVEMMYYKENVNEEIIDQNILTQLREQGYDVIMVNPPTYTTTNHNNGQQVTIDGGAYYIESNALAVVALIKKIKAQLLEVGSTEQIAIVGPSMGGQISRYALAYMEKKLAETNDSQWDHKTRLWISVDSPHLGANIPMGVQSLVYTLKVKEEHQKATFFYDTMLGSPAARQQLIEFHRDAPDDENTNNTNLNGRVAVSGFPSDAGNNYYKIWYNNVNNNGLQDSKGYPQNLRKIALVNGSVTGSKKTSFKGRNGLFKSDNESILNINGYSRHCYDNVFLGFGSYCYDIVLARININNLSSPFSGNKEISYFQVGQGRSNYRVNSENINSRGDMDIVPGGLFRASGTIHDAIVGTKPLHGDSSPDNSFWQYPGDNFQLWFANLGRSRWDVNVLSEVSSFIPSFSSIAHKFPNQSWANPLNYNLVCSEHTYFDSYFGHEENTQHTSFNADSAHWLFQELAGNAQAPYFPIPTTALNGVNAICVNDTTNYYFENCKVPSGATWTISTNTLQLLSSDPYNITVKGIADGFGYITATFQNQQVFTKKIWVGKPQFSGQNYWGGIGTPIGGLGQAELPTYNLCKNYQYTPENAITFELNGLSSNAMASNTYVQWEKVSGDFYFYSNGNKVYFQPHATGQIIIRGRAYNDCGWSNWQLFAINVTDCNSDTEGNGSDPFSPSFASQFTVYPNPANSTLTVEPKDKAQATTYQATLYNLSGMAVAQSKSTTQTTIITTQSLPNGIYTLQITNGTEKESVQIEVKH